MNETAQIHTPAVNPRKSESKIPIINDKPKNAANLLAPASSRQTGSLNTD